MMLRVLNLEDSPDDSWLLERHLKQAGYECTLRREQSETEFEDALRDGSWDVILADYFLPAGFTALSAVRIAQRQDADIPFIVVSGAVGEMAAVEVLREGASDYVNKDSLARLVPAIHREMQKADERRRRRAAEAALRESEMRLRGILDNSSNAMFVKDMSGCYVLVNRCYENTLGMPDEEIRGKTDDHLFPPEYSNVYKENEARVQSAGVPLQFEEQFLLDGQVHTRLANRFLLRDELERPKGICAICTDITERKSTEEALRRSEKLAAAGRLAASIAHEINNPLEALMNLVFLLQKQTELREQSRALLATAEQELNRVSHITRQTLAFYRESTVPAQLDLAGVIKSLIELYRNRIRHREVEIDFTSVGNCTVLSIEGEMRQAFSNLLANAIDASRRQGTVRVRLTSRRQSPGVMRPGVRVTIADNGCGIPRENLHRIFEAFFTTKSDGTGTGLGLWVTKSILEKHNATLAIRSSAMPGASGTVISVFVPDNTDEGQQLEKNAHQKQAEEVSVSSHNQEGAAD